MARNPKMFIHDAVYELCFRTQEGLPMTAAPFMKRIIKGYLAAAQSKYPVTICHYIVMANHIHMIVRVKNPEDLSRFVLYFKRESAHAINALRGRRSCNVWSWRYDSPILLDAGKVIERIVYFYANPAQAGLTSSIDEYPNLSSWTAFLNNGESVMCEKVPRPIMPLLSSGRMSDQEAKAIDLKLKEKSFEKCSLIIEPFAWLDAFDQTRRAELETIKGMIIDKLRLREKQLSLKRKLPLMGAKALIRQNIFQAHIPKKFGKKMICLGSEKSIRKIFIKFFKDGAQKARIAVKQIRLGLSAELPPSFFHPGGYLLSNLLPFYTPLPLG